jgi:hypothetical protein
MKYCCNYTTRIIGFKFSSKLSPPTLSKKLVESEMNDLSSNIGIKIVRICGKNFFVPAKLQERVSMMDLKTAKIDDRIT